MECLARRGSRKHLNQCKLSLGKETIDYFGESLHLTKLLETEFYWGRGKWRQRRRERVREEGEKGREDPLSI